VQTQSIAPADARDTFWRTLLTFAITRVVIAVVLLVYLLFHLNKTLTDPGDYLLYWQTCLIYLLLAAGFAVFALRYRRHVLWQLWTQIAVDLMVISVLYFTGGGLKSGLAILYLFPLAGGAILAPMMLALFFAAIVTIFLLVESGYRMLLLTTGPAMSQAGLYGAAFFFAVFVINRLAARLIAEEALARQRGIDLQVQQAINRLVIADMEDGIVVVGQDGTVLTANPAAERMLGLVLPFDLTRSRLADIAPLAPIADAFAAWAAQSAGRREQHAALPVYVLIKPSDNAALHASATLQGRRKELAFHLKLRFAPVELGALQDERTVIFLEDVTEIENRAQQLKLASMGRLTASIAHEVRNPLSAIAHASALLAEEPANPLQTRLLHIVSDNVLRLDRMIEDILRLSRKAQLPDVPLALAPFIADILDELKQSHAIPAGVVALGNLADYHVWFDPLHLREVVTNLVSNALRYASGNPGSIRIFATPGVAQRIELHVQDDGAPITPDVRAHLFEPFYTTSSKGTGLGLYLARELCLNNGAIIDYEYRSDMAHGRPDEATGRFVITLAAANPL
jgi:two-component system sensor histidine kinase PilS (NtrC family)